MTSPNEINPKVIERIQKLMNLARDGGATEAEASVALSKAQGLMAEYNLSIAAVEQSSGSQTSDRKREKNNKKLMYKWKRELLTTVARVNFCHLLIQWGLTKSGETIANGYDLIGREANLVAANQTFEYLTQTIERLVVAEFGSDPRDRFNRSAHSYRKGLSDGLSDRLEARYRQIVRDQERAAREQQATRRHPSSAPQSTALVLMSEYESSETDLNNDFLNNWEPGTTLRNRKASEARSAALKADREAKIDKFIAELGVSVEVAAYMSYGYSREVAEGLAKPKPIKPMTEAQQRKAREKEERDWRRWQEARDRENRRFDQHYLNRGLRDAEDIGLDDQIDEERRSRLA